MGVQKHLPIGFFLLLASFAAVAQSSNKQAKAVQQIVINLFDGLAVLDTAKIHKACSNDIQLLETGKIWNLDSLLTNTTARKLRIPDFKRVNTIDFFKTEVVGDMAYTSYNNLAVISASGKSVTIQWMETVVLKKISNEWKIATLHSTELKRSN